MKKIALLASAFALTAGTAFAQDQNVKVSGQIFANYHMNQSDDLSTGTAGKSNGFNVDRARLKIDGKINDQWHAHMSAEAKQGAVSAANSNSTFWIKKAYLHANKMFMDNDYFRFGVTSNLYKDNIYKHMSTRWIEKVAGQEYALANGEHAGLRWGMKTDKFHFALDYHNGNQSNFTSGTQDEVTGIALFGSYHINDMMGIHLFHNSNAEAKSGSVASKSTDTYLAFNYNHNMFDGLFEYGNRKLDTTGAETRTNMKLSLDYKYAEGKTIYFSYNKHDDKDTDTAGVVGNNLDNKIVIGPSFTVAKNLKTGIFYSMSKFDDSVTSDDDKAIDWKWEAKF